MAKNHEIRIKFEKEELEKIRRDAIKLGLCVSAYLRMLALSAKTPINLR